MKIFTFKYLRLSLFILLISMDLPLISQESINLSGTVVDSVTGNNLPFAQISLTGTNLGTLSNEDGIFIFDIPSMFANDTVAVAYMGYKTLKFPISSFQFPKVIIIKLPPGQLHLSEVEIIGLTPEEVIRQVVKNIPKNYGETPVILTAFVRSQKIVDGKLAEFTEAIIENQKTGYTLYPARQEENKRKQSNIPDLLKGRVISDTNLVNAMGDIGKSAGCLGCNFIRDFAEFYHQTVLDENLFRYYSFRMEELPGENGKIYHIWFDQRKGVKKTLWKGEMFINASDFALLKITQRPSFEAFETYEKTKFKTLYFISNRFGWYKEMPLMDWTTTYSKRNDYYYLASIHVENWLTFVYPSTGKKTRFGHKNEVVVTDASRDSARIQNFKGDKSIGVNQRWDEVAGNTDDQFWIKFIYLPIEEKLKESLGKLKIKNSPRSREDTK